MTDFVDRMLGRSAGSVIRPLLPTLYEPFTRGAVDEPLPMGSFTDAIGQPVDTEPAAAIQLSEPPSAQVLPEAGPAAPSGIGVSLAATPSQAGPAPEAVPHPAVPIASPALSTPPPHPPADPTDRRAPRDHQSPPRPLPAAVPSAAQPPAHRATMKPPPIPAAPSRSPQRPSAFQQAFVQERDRVRDPDVHISIGRVEIKAAVPTAPPPRRADPARRPQLTLDDYLKSRGS